MHEWLLLLPLFALGCVAPDFWTEEFLARLDEIQPHGDDLHFVCEPPSCRIVGPYGPPAPELDTMIRCWWFAPDLDDAHSNFLPLDYVFPVVPEGEFVDE